ncbi:MAG: hypothetical protein OSA93_18325 [Akkermansiaceae bacterium]|nr:hypothetical protein [Akkermansiaceae bacterium]
MQRDGHHSAPRYPGFDLSELARIQESVESHGLRVATVEGYLPIESLKLGADHDGAELARMKALIQDRTTPFPHAHRGDHIRDRW